MNTEILSSEILIISMILDRVSKNNSAWICYRDLIDIEEAKDMLGKYYNSAYKKVIDYLDSSSVQKGVNPNNSYIYYNRLMLLLELSDRLKKDSDLFSKSLADVAISDG